MQLKPLFAFCICMAAAPASAATITFSDLFPLSDADISGVASVSKFDPSLGTLTAVSWEVVGAIATILGISNNGSTTIDGSAFVSIEFDLISDQITVPGAPAFDVLASTGPVTLGVGESVLFPITAQTTITGTEAVSATFIGPGTINLAFLTATSFGATGFGGDLTVSQASDAGLQFSITYEFDDRPPPAHVPLPASAFLLLAGLGALGLARRRRS